MIPPYAAAAIIVVAAIVASGVPLELAGATPSGAGCVKLYHEHAGGYQRYRADVVTPGRPTPFIDDPCPADTAPTFRVMEDTCLDLELRFGTHSPLNGAPPVPTDMRLYLVEASHPARHGTLGRDGWPETPVVQGNEGIGRACVTSGDYRLVIRACRYGPTPMHPASEPQCDGIFVYDINSDDLGRTLPIYHAYG